MSARAFISARLIENDERGPCKERVVLPPFSLLALYHLSPSGRLFVHDHPISPTGLLLRFANFRISTMSLQVSFAALKIVVKEAPLLFP